MTLLKNFQNELSSKLQRHFPSVPVITEWKAMQGEGRLYCPRLDVAVGPFAIDEQYVDEYDNLMENDRILIERMLYFHKRNVTFQDFEVSHQSFDDLKTKNYNARCFLAIEIENEVSRKHLIGGIVNASALGRIGIIIAWSDEKLRALLRQRKYLSFLKNVDKNTFDTTNLLILRPEQLTQAIDELSGVRNIRNR